MLCTKQTDSEKIISCLSARHVSKKRNMKIEVAHCGAFLLYFIIIDRYYSHFSLCFYIIPPTYVCKVGAFVNDINIPTYL